MREVKHSEALSAKRLYEMQAQRGQYASAGGVLARLGCATRRLRNTANVMSEEESTTPDLVELTRSMFDAASCHDLDGLMGLYAPDAVYDASHAGLGISFEGVAAIRSFIAEWWETFEDHQTEVLEIAALSQGVAFARVREVGRPVASAGQVEQFRGWVLLGTGGKIEHVEPYFDATEARAAAERLAEERDGG